MVRFAQLVRANTPETSGFFDPEIAPEYGILVKPSFGHVFSYVARRSTPATGFGPYLDYEKYRAALKFYNARNTTEARSALDFLGTRYVVTRAVRKGGAFANFLHRQNGSSADGTQRVGDLRLVVEGPAGGPGSMKDPRTGSNCPPSSQRSSSRCFIGSARLRQCGPSCHH